MPLMTPPTSAWKRTPSSTGVASACEATAGLADAAQMPHGHVRATLITREAGTLWTLPLSSTARTWMVIGTLPVAAHGNSHVSRSVPASHDVPPSTDTSTLARTPPVSAAVPLMTIESPLCTVEFAGGDTMAVVGSLK